ncbi:MAG: hypothetical protein ACKO8H_04105 [Microcystis panniformis]
MVPTSDQANDFIQKNALSSGVTNAVINGVIGWFMFRGKDTLPLTVDTISGHEKTVFSTGVMTAFILSLILGMIAFFTFRKKAKDFHVASPELLERPFFFFWSQDSPVLCSVCLWYSGLGCSILAKVFGDDSGNTCYRCNYLRDYRRDSLLVY